MLITIQIVCPTFYDSHKTFQMSTWIWRRGQKY